MKLKRFSVLVIIRIALLTATIFVLSRIFGNVDLFFNQLILTVILVIQIVELVHFVNQTNRELSRFFLSIRHGDFSVSFRDNGRGQSFRELNEGFAELVDAYKKVKIEKEVQYQFLQKLVNQIGIGIISIENDTIGLINPRAEELLGMQGIKNWTLARQISPSVTRTLDEMANEDRRLIEIRTQNVPKIIAVDVSTITILEKYHRIITLQDINTEIEQKEFEAWNKLIRILTHEIMNSVTPISSLTETLQGLLTNRDGSQKKSEQLTEDTIADMRFSLGTIHKRSEGLLNFVENYRKLSRVPKPSMEQTGLRDYLHHVANLLSPSLKENGISIHINVTPESASIMLDPSLVEQVLINLIQNSIQAVSTKEKKLISVSGYPFENAMVIEIKDNGCGIEEKMINEVFVPFFSTKADGSGIGLSLSKQIMAVHGGHIRVASKPGEGTSFFLQFRRERNSVTG
jgi:two-component system, NtrC family, nitrogen regulation sensor histidine kinase NtrY